jgi:hypothetical protein
VIEIDRSRVVMFDSLRKPKEDYQDLIDIIQRACSQFLRKHIGVTSMPCELEFKLDKQVQI